MDRWLVPGGGRARDPGGGERREKEQYGTNGSCRVRQRHRSRASVQTAPSMLGPWNHPTCHLIKCRGLNIEGAVHARHLILHRSHRAAPRARVSPQSGRKSFVRDCSLHVSSRPVVPSSALRGLFGSRVSYRVPPPLSRVPRQPRRSSPLLSGAQTGHFPASLPRTFGAACMARLPASPSTVYPGRI